MALTDTEAVLIVGAMPTEVATEAVLLTVVTDTVAVLVTVVFITTVVFTVAYIFRALVLA